MKRFTAFCGASLLNLSVATAAQAQPFETVISLDGPNDPTMVPLEFPKSSLSIARENLMNPVVIFGDQIVLGIPAATNADGFQYGEAYIHDALTGKARTALQNPTPSPRDHFGNAVAMTADYALVGAPGYRPNEEMSFVGAAYLFDLMTGKIKHSFFQPEPDNLANFGSAVALSASYALIGAPWWSPDEDNIDHGKVSLFDLETGAHLHSFEVPTDLKHAEFGTEVALSDQFAVIATGRADAVYVFDTQTGGLVTTFTGPDPVDTMFYGSPIALHDGRLLVGRFGRWGCEGGFVYLYDLTTTELLQTFTRPNCAGGTTSFGNTLALDEENVAIMGYTADSNDGSIATIDTFIFDIDSGALQQTYTVENGERAQQFFGDMSISSGRLVFSVCDDFRGGGYEGASFVAALP